MISAGDRVIYRAGGAEHEGTVAWITASGKLAIVHGPQLRAIHREERNVRPVDLTIF